MSNSVNAIVAALVIAILLVIGGLLVGNVAQTAEPDNAGAEAVNEPVLLGAAGQTVTIGDLEGVDETVVNSKGKAINFTGANDSYVETTEAVDYGTVGNWSVTTGARLDPGATTENMTVVSVSGDVLIQYNASRGNWTAYYYDRASRQSWRVDVNAPSPSANFTVVTATANQTHFWIYANTTRGEVVNITGSNTAEYGNYTNFDGRVDETNTFNDTTNSSEQAGFVTNPIGPRPDRYRTARLMFDRPNRSTQLMFFAPANIVASNATGAAGFAGSEMQSVDDTLFATADYRWYVEGPKIKPLSGGELDGAPVAYVSYTQRIGPTGIVGGFADAMAFAAIIPIVLVAMALLGVVSRFG